MTESRAAAPPVAGGGRAAALGPVSDAVRPGRPRGGDPVPGGTPAKAREMEKALLDLRRPIVSLALPLRCPGAEEARGERRRLLSQIDDYLLPRLRQAGTPVLIAIVGSTGAGKSTLLNSVVGHQVSATGIRRPTTNSPVLACHPGDAGWFAENVFLPTLPRVRQQGLVMPGRDGLLVLAASDRIPAGTALLDTPDIDSVVAAHHEFASQFLDASDLWLFVTTARRYADAAVWELLKDARDRSASLAIVLSRVPPAAADQLSAHFDAMLTANGLGDVPRFLITETTVADAMLPVGESAPVRRWVEAIAGDDEQRIAILTRTMSGVLDTFRGRITELAAQADAQRHAAAELRAEAHGCYAAALTEVTAAAADGAMLTPEIIARWQDLAADGRLLRPVQDTVRRPARPAGGAAGSGAPAPGDVLRAAVSAGLVALITAAAGRAAERAAARWQSVPAGAALLAEADAARGRAGRSRGKPLDRSSPELPGTAARAIRGWHQQLRQLVRQELAARRPAGRPAQSDGGALALALCLAALAPGDEAASERAANSADGVLDGLLGAERSAELRARARVLLYDSTRQALAPEARRFAGLIDALELPEPDTSSQLYAAAQGLDSVR